MSWQIMGRLDRQGPNPTPLRNMNPDTGEIRENAGGFAGLVEDRDWYADVCGKVAEALGPDVLRRWQDGDETLNLAAEVKRQREQFAVADGTAAGYRRVLAEAFDPDAATAEIGSLMAQIHQRLDGGVDIQTFGDGTAEVRWRRLYHSTADDAGELSDERFTSAQDLVTALRNVLATEDEADGADAAEASR